MEDTNSTSTSTAVSLSWITIPGTVLDSYNISYSTDGDCAIPGGERRVDSHTLNYTFSGLEEDILYEITVSALYKGHIIGSDTTVVTTQSVGMYYTTISCHVIIRFCSQFHLPLLLL